MSVVFRPKNNGWNSFFCFLPLPRRRGFPTAGGLLYLANKNVPVTEDEAKAQKKTVFRSFPKSKQKTQPKSANPETWTPASSSFQKKEKKKEKKRAVMRLATNQPYPPSMIGWLPELGEAQGSSFRSVRGHRGHRNGKQHRRKGNGNKPAVFILTDTNLSALLAVGRERNAAARIRS